MVAVNNDIDRAQDPILLEVAGRFDPTFSAVLKAVEHVVHPAQTA